MVDGLKKAISNSPRRRAVEDRLSVGDRAAIKIERHALLLRAAPIESLVSIVNALITLAVAWGKIDTVMIGVWAGLVIALSAARLYLWRRFSTRQPSGHGLLGFTRAHVIAMGLNGALWGALAPIFAISGMLENAYLPFIVAGMTATAIASAGASWRSVFAFNVPALAALAISYAVLAPSDGLLIAAVIVLYGVASAYLAFSTQQMIERSIRLRARNDNLLGALKREVDAAHEAEQRYRALVESSSEVTLIFSPQGAVVYASPAVESALGAPPQNLIGLTTRDLVHPNDLERFRTVGGQTLSKIGDVTPLDHVCLRGANGYVAMSGRLSNMLYVPGVEGFVFVGGLIEEAACRHLPAAE